MDLVCVSIANFTYYYTNYFHLMTINNFTNQIWKWLKIDNSILTMNWQFFFVFTHQGGNFITYRKYWQFSSSIFIILMMIMMIIWHFEPMIWFQHFIWWWSSMMSTWMKWFLFLLLLLFIWFHNNYFSLILISHKHTSTKQSQQINEFKLDFFLLGRINFH